MALKIYNTFALFCIFICLCLYIIIGVVPKERVVAIEAPVNDSLVLKLLANKFIETHPYNVTAGYQCLQIARDYKEAVSVFGYKTEIELGCRNENISGCHAWINYSGTELFGKRVAFPYLMENNASYYLELYK